MMPMLKTIHTIAKELPLLLGSSRRHKRRHNDIVAPPPPWLLLLPRRRPSRRAAATKKIENKTRMKNQRTLHGYEKKSSANNLFLELLH